MKAEVLSWDAEEKLKFRIQGFYFNLQMTENSAQRFLKMSPAQV